jgi:hypothetical protein
MHHITDLGLQLDRLANSNGMVKGDVAAELVGPVKVDQGPRDIRQALPEIALLPRPPGAVKVGVVRPEDGVGG